MTQQPSPWLRFAWTVWLIYALLMITLLLAGLPQLIAKAAIPCNGDGCNFIQITTAQAERLNEAGITLNTHALIRVCFILIFDSAFGVGLAFLLYWRKRNDWIALILAVPTLSHATNYPGAISLMESAYPVLMPLTRLPAAAIMVFWYLFFCTFPDSGFVPRWGRWLAPVAIGVGLFAFDPAIYEPGHLTGIIAGTIWFPLSFILGLAFQSYRYWRVSNFSQRQQARWFIYTLAVSLGVSLIVLPLLRTLIPALADVNGPVRLYVDQIAGSFFGPIIILFGFWIAIIRYQMFDIDLIIRRTLQYSVLTGLLGLVYFGSVVLLQAILGQTTGERSPLVLVLSTLLIAGLFAPLRGRVQTIIDRRFYRQKYDAAKVLADFARTARDETDINQLTGRLVEVVQETLQPEQVSLWLKPTTQRGWNKEEIKRSAKSVNQ